MKFANIVILEVEARDSPECMRKTREILSREHDGFTLLEPSPGTYFDDERTVYINGIRCRKDDEEAQS